MDKDRGIGEKIKEQIERFSRIISGGMFKPRRKFISQMLFGIQASRDVKLSNIGRSLDEPVDLIKTEWRLSRNLQQEDLTDRVNEVLIKDGSKRVGEDTVLALDLSDINKPFAQKMEYLAWVWDGSRGEVARGFWICSVVGAEARGEEVTPLYGELYSQEAVGFVGENEQLLKAVRVVNEGVKGKGIWAIDRGGDRRILVEELVKLRVKFVIRMTMKRDIVTPDAEVENIREFAQRLPVEEKYTVTVDREGYLEKLELSLSKARGIRIGEMDLNLVVVRGFGEEPMILLTNTDKGPREVLEIYLTRWKCEESFRFLKQEYHLEDVRVRSYVSLRNTVILVQAVFYFLSVYLGRRLRMNILLKKILEKAKRFFQIPVFNQYAIADGIYRILFNVKWGTKPKKPVWDPGQLEFGFCLDI